MGTDQCYGIPFRSVITNPRKVDLRFCTVLMILVATRTQSQILGVAKTHQGNAQIGLTAERDTQETNWLHLELACSTPDNRHWKFDFRFCGGFARSTLGNGPPCRQAVRTVDDTERKCSNKGKRPRSASLTHRNPQPHRRSEDHPSR